MLNNNRWIMKVKYNYILYFLIFLQGGTVDVTVHKMLEDGRVRELYKATGGAWGGTKVDEAFIKYFCEMFTKEVIDNVKHEYPDDWVEMMLDFEKIKRKISLNSDDDFAQIALRPCIQEVYQEVMNVNLKNAFKNIPGKRGATLNRHKIQIPKQVITKKSKKRKISLNNDDDFAQIALRPCIQEVYQEVMNVNLKNAFKNIPGKRGATLNRHKLQIPKTVISEMIKQVAKSISSHATFLLQQKENQNLDFIVMIGGFSNSPIVVQEVKDQVSSSLPVIVPENAELSVVQGAVMFGWKPDIFKSRKSKRTYGLAFCPFFRENIDPEYLICYDDNYVKRCKYRFDKLVSVNEDIEIDHTVKRIYHPVKRIYHPSKQNQLSVAIRIYESEKYEVIYCDEPGTRQLGSITIPMTDTTGGMNRKIEITVRFGGTEIVVNGKDLTTGVDVKAVYDFL